MDREPLRVIARVECRSEGAGDERPVAVWVGGTRHRIREIVEDAVHGPVRAAGDLIRRMTVVAEGVGRLSLSRPLPDGEWRVFRVE